MIRLFCLFVDWCSARGMHADDYQIVIVPKTVEAEARFKRAWDKEFANLAWERPEVGGIYDGMMCGVPFKIESHKP